MSMLQLPVIILQRLGNFGDFCVLDLESLVKIAL